MTILDRRSFLKWVGAAAVPLALRGERPGAGPGAAPPAGDGPPRIRKFNPLGKTGLKISDIGFGGINYFNPDVARYAFECGVNAFDTAEAYGQSERMLGQALRGVRDKAVITTKQQLTTPEQTTTEALVRRVEESLGRLQTDYVDIALVHAVDDPSRLHREEVLEAYARLKKAGKVRFTGFSTHQPAKTLSAAIETDLYDVVLLTYNHLEGRACEPLLERARAKGVGTIAMKVLAGGKQGALRALVDERTKYSRAAMRWVLGNPSIDSLIITMSTFSHVEDYVGASGQALERGDLDALSRYSREAGPLYCRVSCSECLASCPHGVAVNEVLRYAMYFEDYGMEKRALEFYAGLDEVRKPLPCEGCPAPCEEACPHGLEVRGRLLRAGALLSP